MTALARLTATPDRDVLELRILVGPDSSLEGDTVLSSFGMASTTLRTATPDDASDHVFRRMIELSERIHGVGPELFAALTYFAARLTTRADHRGAFVACEQLESHLRDLDLDPATRAFLRGPTAVNAFWRGELPRARALLEELVRHELVSDQPIQGAMKRHTVLVVYLAGTRWLMGDGEAALIAAKRALEIAREVGDPYTIAAAGNMCIDLHFLRGDPVELVRAACDDVLALPEMEPWSPHARVVLAWIRARIEPMADEVALQLRESFDRRIAALPMGATWQGTFLAEALRAGGQEARARALVHELLAFADAHDERVAQPHLERLRAELATR